VTKHVVIIGGGFAGLAAGTALAELGHRVTLFERRPRLGGRAYSFRDARTGDIVDNGQHLMMGCYHETVIFLKRIGSLGLVKFFDTPRVDFFDAHGATALHCPPLPAPLHLLAGLMRLRGLSWAEKLGAIRVGLAIQPNIQTLRKKTADLTVAAWLDALGQSPRIRERFWDPLIVATLNETPEKAAAALLIQVLKQGFCGSVADSRMGVSTVGLSELYVEQSKSFIERRGGCVRLQAPVARILVSGGKCVGVELSSGEIVHADACICAVPHHDVSRFMPVDCNPFAELHRIGVAPIISINLWFDRPVMRVPFAGLIGTRTQWVFNKNAFSGDDSPLHRLALIISAAHEYENASNEELVSIALDDLRSALPHAHQAKLVHSRAVRERTATFSATVDAERLRPNFRSPVHNLLLAGDWTDTKLPATIEGAVLSGHRCADLAIGDFLRGT
jgi:zeta-carotene desaturase